MDIRWSRIFAATIAVVAIAMLLTQPETVTEINAATGTVRTRRIFAGLLKGAWKESPTWVSERARHLGVVTGHEWQLLSKHSHIGFIVSRGCSKAPVSYQLRSVPEDEIPEEQRDTFVRQFAEATEKEREAILRQLYKSLTSTDPL
jgi:hypothetical protein